jgi:carbon monoxide dehydrogenase subunit G
MAMIQQSIEINAPVRAVYNQLTQFEDYPQFMESVETVKQVDDTHLHWSSTTSNRPVEWDAEIVEQKPDRCIAWNNTGGPTNGGRIEVQPAGEDASRVTFTLQAEAGQMSGAQAGSDEKQMAQQLKQDLARLKEFIESRGAESGAWRGEVHDAQVTMRDRDARAQGGSEAARAAGLKSPAAPSDETMQSDYSLSKSTDDESADDGRFSIAAEVNLDQQSDQVRRVGQMPSDSSAEHNGATSASEAMGKAMQKDQRQPGKGEALRPSINRAVPPSE